jgi:hypothetical protein
MLSRMFFCRSSPLYGAAFALQHFETKLEDAENADVQHPAFVPNPKILAARARGEDALEALALDARHRIKLLDQRLLRGNLSASEHARLMTNLRRQVVEQSQIIVYGEHARSRENFIEEYGCVRCTEPAVATCTKHSPLIEIGAGAGQWQSALTDAGADIVAYDTGANLPMPEQQPKGVVQHGDETELSLNRHRGRTLLLVYPPPGPLAKRCLDVYRGETVLYVGEGRQGCNGDGQFFDAIEADYHVEKIVQLEPFPGGSERLYVLKRKTGCSQVWWLWPWVGIAGKMLLNYFQG